MLPSKRLSVGRFKQTDEIVVNASPGGASKRALNYSGMNHGHRDMQDNQAVNGSRR